MSDDQPQGKPQKLHIQLDEETALGRYSNLVLLNHSENEFFFDFAFVQPGGNKAKIVSRIISTPRHTKRLLRALQQNVERFESRFGTIDAGDGDDGTSVH